MSMAARDSLFPIHRLPPALVAVVRWVAAAQFCWLAWQLAQTRLSPGDATGPLPAAAGGVLLNLVNPATWLGGLLLVKDFVIGGPPILQAGAAVAICVVSCQGMRSRASLQVPASV